MKVAIIGGRLQGLEAAYLAKKAGWQTLLVDKKSDVPAAGLCDRFFCLDATEKNNLAAILDQQIDLIIPALENHDVLQTISEVAGLIDLPLVFDPAAYELSSSKVKSDRYFADLDVPVPNPWPGGNFPYIAKPSGASGSEGVILLRGEDELQRFLQQRTGASGQWVLQEYIEGPSYSIEVIGNGSQYIPLQVTELHMDKVYDCKRVVAPSNLGEQQQKVFAGIAVKLATGLGLRGIMDVEVILHDHKLKVLEIDARLPSQTPTAVFHSTGVNMLELLASVFIENQINIVSPGSIQKTVIFEHLAVSPGSFKIAGEHIIAGAGSLNHVSDFFGADEALTDFKPGKKSWVATLIITGMDREETFARRLEVIERIGKETKSDWRSAE
jgi:3-methylornithine--L-lysine ligase